MHYKNGREAKVGDKILVQPTYGAPYVAVLLGVTPGSTSCNGTAMPVDPFRVSSVTLGECTHLDDVRVSAGEDHGEEV